MSTDVIDQERLICFSQIHGGNVKVDGQVAEWYSKDSGGRLFVKNCLTVGDKLTLEFNGKGHIEMGLMNLNPQNISGMRNFSEVKEYIPAQTARIYKQIGLTKIMRTTDRVTFDSDGKVHEIVINKDKKIWVIIYLVFGDITVKSDCNLIKLNGNGGNIEEENNIRKLRYPNPCALCFIPTPLNLGEYLLFDVNRLNREGKIPKNFSIKVGISEYDPTSLQLDQHNYYDITSFEDVFVQNLPLKTHGELRIELMENQQIRFCHGKGSNTYKDKVFDRAFCIFEISRVTVKCVSRGRIADANESDVHIVLREIADVRDNIQFISQIKGPDSERASHFPEDYREVMQQIVDNKTETYPRAILDNVVKRLDLIEMKLSEKETSRLEYRKEVNVLRKEVGKIRVLLRSHAMQAGKERVLYWNNPVEGHSFKYPPLKDILQNHYTVLVDLIDPIYISDHLFQMGKVSADFHERLRNLVKTDKQEANRELLTKIRKIDLLTWEFIKILEDTKQSGVLRLIQKE